MEAKKGLAKSIEGKLRTDLVEPEWIEAIAEVMTYSSTKYDERSWQSCDRGDSFTVDYAAAMRHLLKWRKGQMIDEQSGLSHLAHAAADILIMLWHEYKAYPEIYGSKT